MARSRIRMYCVRQAMVSLALLASSGWAQDTAPTEQEKIALLEQQIKELQQHDRELEDRIRALEVHPNESSTTNVPQPAIEPTPPPATAQATPPPTPEMHTVRGIQWRGFGELDYKVLDQRTPELGTYGFVPGSAGNFYTGDFGLFLTAKISEKTSALAEIDFEEGDAQTYSNPDLRRILLKYDYNDHLKVSFGRYQTGVGYYNWAFRSAAWLQTTADRPLIMEFAKDGGPLPTQAVGVYATGSIPSGKLGLNYIAEYGSSDTIRPDINGDGFSTDENNGNHTNVGLFLTPDRFPGLRIGGSVYHDQISDLQDVTATGTQIPQATDSERWNQTIVNGHVVYVAHGIEVLNEGFLVRHAPIGPGPTFNTPAFYSQFSKKFGPVRPFFRYQYINASSQNELYEDIGLRYGPSFGARYDINDFLAVKAQLDRTGRRGEPDIDGFQLQLAFTF